MAASCTGRVLASESRGLEGDSVAQSLDTSHKVRFEKGLAKLLGDWPYLADDSERRRCRRRTGFSSFADVYVSMLSAI
jgi:hypothetical protein